MIYLVIILPIVTLVTGFFIGAKFGSYVTAMHAIKVIDEALGQTKK